MSEPHPDRPLMRLRAFDTRFCFRCNGQREFSKRIAAHLWHLGLTVATFGLWGVGWLAVAIIEAQRPWRCTVCHSRYVPETTRRRYAAANNSSDGRIKLPFAPRSRKPPGMPPAGR